MKTLKLVKLRDLIAIRSFKVKLKALSCRKQKNSHEGPYFKTRRHAPEVQNKIKELIRN
jgi:hypothetical protein